MACNATLYVKRKNIPSQIFSGYKKNLSTLFFMHLLCAHNIHTSSFCAYVRCLNMRVKGDIVSIRVVEPFFCVCHPLLRAPPKYCHPRVVLLVTHNVLKLPGNRIARFFRVGKFLEITRLAFYTFFPSLSCRNSLLRVIREIFPS